MLSLPDMAVLGGLALIIFGPERLPKIARQAGRVMGEVKATSNAFVREMERAAAPARPVEPPPLPAPFAPAEPAVEARLHGPAAAGESGITPPAPDVPESRT